MITEEEFKSLSSNNVTHDFSIGFGDFIILSEKPPKAFVEGRRYGLYRNMKTFRKETEALQWIDKKDVCHPDKVDHSPAVIMNEYQAVVAVYDHGKFIPTHLVFDWEPSFYLEINKEKVAVQDMSKYVVRELEQKH